MPIPLDDDLNECVVCHKWHQNGRGARCGDCQDRAIGGGLDILNTGAGHIEVRYDNNDPIEIDRAKRIITDMLRRGYSLFIEGADKALIRVESFDAVKGVYLIADLGEPETVSPPQERPRKRKPTKEIKMTEAKATAIGRSAGG